MNEATGTRGIAILPSHIFLQRTWSIRVITEDRKAFFKIRSIAWSIAEGFIQPPASPSMCEGTAGPHRLNPALFPTL